MTNRTLQFHPGPKAIAAAFKLAGFSETSYYPAVTDACGTHWPKPSGLHMAVAICGGECSGNVWAYHKNADGSTDFGAMQINDRAHENFISQVQDQPTGWNWMDFYNNAQAAYAIHVDGGKYDWAPWMAYVGGGYLEERYANQSWMHWADEGISQMLVSLTAYQKQGKDTATALGLIASVNTDPLVIP